MTQALRCPACSAPLDPPAGGGTSARCPYCDTTVLLDNKPAGINLEYDERGARTGGFVDNANRVYQRTRQSPVSTPRVATGTSSSGPKLAVLASVIGICAFIGVVAHKTLRTQATTVRLTPLPQFSQVLPPPVPSIFALPSPPPSSEEFAKLTLTFGSEGIGAGQFRDARSIALDGNGHIYVGEYTNGRVQVFDAVGRFIKTWSLDPPGTILNLTADRNGTLLVVTPGHVLCYEGITGVPMGEAAVTNGDEQETYMDAFVSSTGDIYAIGVNSDIVVLSSQGRIKRTFNARKKVDESVTFDKIVANGTGDIYALDRSKGIFKFAPDGRYINRFAGGDGPGAARFAQSLAVDGQGRIYVGGGSPSISVFDGDGRRLDGFGGNEICFGVAINDKNEIFGCFRNRCEIRKFEVVPAANR